MNQKQDFFTVLNGRVKFYAGEYNITSDPVWLAAFVNAKSDKKLTVLDVGIGTGGATFPLLTRVPTLTITGIDISNEMLNECKKNAKLNNQTIELIHSDITTWHTNRTFDLVITNPPYFKGIPRRKTATAHHNADITAWIRASLKRLKPRGYFYCIVDAAVTGEAIASLYSGKAGDITIIPLFGAGKEKSAERVLISARLGTRGPTRLFAALPMNNDRVLRDMILVDDL